jgi:hypothetical protein
MQKQWTKPQLRCYGDIEVITQQTTVTCPSDQKQFGSEDGFVVGGIPIGCPLS